MNLSYGRNTERRKAQSLILSEDRENHRGKKGFAVKKREKSLQWDNDLREEGMKKD